MYVPENKRTFNKPDHHMKVKLKNLKEMQDSGKINNFINIMKLMQIQTVMNCVFLLYKITDELCSGSLRELEVHRLLR